MKTLVSLLSMALVAVASAAPTEPKTTPQDVPDNLRAMLEMMRTDVNSTKIRTINKVMELTGLEADVFWPIYRAYEKELAPVGDRKAAMIREFLDDLYGGKMDRERSKAMAERWLKNAQERLDLWKKYHKKITKALSSIRGAQFLQIEHQMALFIDLNIASEMPVFKAGTDPKKP
jgi:hypothetical protein